MLIQWSFIMFYAQPSKNHKYNMEHTDFDFCICRNVKPTIENYYFNRLFSHCIHAMTEKSTEIGIFNCWSTKTCENLKDIFQNHYNSISIKSVQWKNALISDHNLLQNSITYESKTKMLIKESSCTHTHKT